MSPALDAGCRNERTITMINSSNICHSFLAGVEVVNAHCGLDGQQCSLSSLKEAQIDLSKDGMYWELHS